MHSDYAAIGVKRPVAHQLPKSARWNKPKLKRFLWITWVAPFPERDGQLMYSGRLIDAVARAGASVHVLCLAGNQREGLGSSPPGSVTWHTVDRDVRSAWRSIFSKLPNVAHRADGADVRRALRILLSGRKWDGIVLDGLAAGWALAALPRLTGDERPAIVHVSHNHETSTRAAVARACNGNPILRYLLRRDANKTRRLERKLVGDADVVTAITQEDADLFRQDYPDCRPVVLTPGYSGTTRVSRTIDTETPRVAAIVGSFNWVAKKQNLHEFLLAADRKLHDSGIRLRVVGRGDAEFLEEIQNNMRSVEVIGEVDSITPYLEDARIAVVPELTGGGFKLKLLDYVNLGGPVFALAGARAGTPWRPRQSAMGLASFDALGDGIVNLMDDADRLNDLQERAFDACRGMYDWKERGEALLRAVVDR
jgi:glycosyltransferase involved in cell wall biosynthesis